MKHTPYLLKTWTEKKNFILFSTWFPFETTRCHPKEAFFRISSYSREYEYFIYKETNEKVPWERYQTEINNEQTKAKSSTHAQWLEKWVELQYSW